MTSEQHIDDFLNKNGRNILKENNNVTLLAKVRNNQNVSLEIGLRKSLQRGWELPNLSQFRVPDSMVINYVEVGSIELLGAPSLKEKEDKAQKAHRKPRPLKKRATAGSKARGGHSISRWDAHVSGTLGCQVTVKDVEGHFFLTNAHVAAGSHGRQGDLIFQPARSDSYCRDFLDCLEKTVFGCLESSKLDNYHDAALVRVFNGGERLDGGIQDVTISSEWADPKMDISVTKCGRTTVVTTGNVQSVKAYAKVIMDPSEPDLIFEDQIIADLDASPGDSGSILVQGESPVGLIFARTNNWSEDEEDLSEETAPRLPDDSDVPERIPQKKYTLANPLAPLFKEGFIAMDGKGSNLVLESFVRGSTGDP